MDQVLVSVGAQAPGLVVGAVIVWFFLQHLAKESDKSSARDNLMAETLARVNSECHAFQVQTTADHKAISERLQAALDRNAEAMTKCTMAHERIERLIVAKGQ